MTNPATYLDDQLEDLEPPYESPAHRRIGRVFDRYGIQFFYRQPALIYEDGQHHIWRPDFTLPGYNGLVVEYIAAASQTDYALAVRRKQHVYQANQIPAVFEYTPEFSDPAWPRHLVERVNRVSRNANIRPTYSIQQAGSYR